MDPEIRRLTNRHGAAAAVVSFLLQPIPAADELAVVPIQYRLLRKAAKARGMEVPAALRKPVRRIIWWGAGARLVANFSLGIVPVAGALVNSITALALTEFLGRYVDEALAHPDREPPTVTMKDLKDALAQAVKRPAARATPAP